MCVRFQLALSLLPLFFAHTHTTMSEIFTQKSSRSVQFLLHRLSWHTDDNDTTVTALQFNPRPASSVSNDCTCLAKQYGMSIGKYISMCCISTEAKHIDRHACCALRPAQLCICECFNRYKTNANACCKCHSKCLRVIKWK